MAIKKLRGGSSAKSSSTPATTRKRVVEDEDNPGKLKLPASKITIPKTLDSYSLCLYGEKGIGKTSLAGQFPNHLIFQFDPRRINVSVKQVPGPDEPPLTWSVFRKYINLIENRSDSKRMTVVVDIVYRAYELALSYVCQKIGVEITHPSQMNDYGATWKAIENEFEGAMERIRAANCQLVIVAHASFKEVPLQTGTAFELLVPQSTKAVWNYLRAMDLVFYYGYTGRDRTLQVRGDDFTWAACGVEGTYLNKKGNPVRKYAMPDTATGAYKVLLDGFGNKINGYVEEAEDA